MALPTNGRHPLSTSTSLFSPFLSSLLFPLFLSNTHTHTHTLTHRRAVVDNTHSRLTQELPPEIFHLIAVYLDTKILFASTACLLSMAPRLHVTHLAKNKRQRALLEILLFTHQGHNTRRRYNRTSRTKVYRPVSIINIMDSEANNSTNKKELYRPVLLQPACTFVSKFI